MITGIRLRQLTVGLGIGTIAFGALPLLFPRPFARLFGIPMEGGPATDVVVRSVSARDVVSGVGILSAVHHGGRVAPWLLGRTLTDGADAAAVAIAALSGSRNPRLLALGAIAVGATILDLVLYLSHKAAARAVVPPGVAGRATSA
jgi:hypothetical protein